MILAFESQLTRSWEKHRSNNFRQVILKKQNPVGKKGKSLRLVEADRDWKLSDAKEIFKSPKRVGTVCLSCFSFRFFLFSCYSLLSFVWSLFFIFVTWFSELIFAFKFALPLLFFFLQKIFLYFLCKIIYY